jgi:F-box protein, helicase, 18
LNITKLNEEVNLLYVAVTRTRYQLYIPESLLPAGFAGAPYIHVQKGRKEIKAIGSLSRSAAPRSSARSSVGKRAAVSGEEKAYTVSEKRELTKGAYQPWTPDLDKELRKMAETRASIGKIAEHFRRTKGAIYARLKKLGYFSE